MLSIQIDGTFTYADNVRNLKIGDEIKLLKNPNNRINKEAIGAYTLDNKKIGYVPYKENQINIKAKYNIEKIRLRQGNPILTISRDIEKSNIINIESDYVKSIKYEKIKKIKHNYDDVLIPFKKLLERNQSNVNDIFITYVDEDFINLYIKCNEEAENNSNLFYTITKKYYEENVFIYDEFYKLGLIPLCIYQPFQVHRLEIYIQNNYNDINKLLNKKPLKKTNFLKNKNLQELFIVKTSKIDINNIADNDILKLAIQYNLSNHKYYDLAKDVDINIDELKSDFTNLRPGGIAFNHEIKSYCQIDIYDDSNIIEIINNDIVYDYNLFMTLLLKLIISDKLVANIYNSVKGTLSTFEPEIELLEEIITLLN